MCDITAKTEAARLVITAQMFFDLILLGFGARVFVSAVELGRRRKIGLGSNNLISPS